MVDFEAIWRRIVMHEGETFQRKDRTEFTYRIEGDYVQPSPVTVRIAKSQFRYASELMPLDGPGEITRTVFGPAYVWAILMDERIRAGQW